MKKADQMLKAKTNKGYFPMRVVRFCHKLLRNTSIHKSRLKVLSEVVETVIKHKVISVTGVGRALDNGQKSRSNIRKVDRLYSNAWLYSEQEEIYSRISETLIKSPRPFIVVDGSKLPNSPWSILRASLVSQGRAITLYEHQYEQSEQCSQKLYGRFLEGLGRVLGPKVSPIIVTDAEFRGPWFKLIRAQGWDFIGRIRGNANVAFNDIDEPDDWRELWPKASSKPRHLGEGYYNRQHEIIGYFYLYKSKDKGRHAHTRSGRPSRTMKSNKHKACAREPWLLISSLDASAKYIVTAYKFRMSIEENFRDTKSGRYGFGLEMTSSKQKKRYANMLIISAIAALIAYLFGVIGEANNLHRDFQANSTRNKRVLSRFFLGCEMVKKKLKITMTQWNNAIQLLERETILCFTS